MKSKNKYIGITMGDPGGVGPEVIAKALAKPSIRELANFLIIGDYRAYARYSTKIPKGCGFIDTKFANKSKDFEVGVATPLGGQAALDYLNIAIRLLKEKKITGLVTAPVCKESIKECCPSFVGHTEYLAENFKVKKYGMFFAADNIRAIVVTRHIPLKDVPKAVTKESVYIAIQLTNDALKKFFRIKVPKIVVCGLNPHAGEGGKIGNEEIKTIIPAMVQAKKKGINVFGPFAADTIFTKNVTGRYDAVVAMYHDQGLIGIKTMCFEKLVNITVGLPFIRTSPAHGTAFNIAGKNIADATSMCEAIKLAATLAR